MNPSDNQQSGQEGGIHGNVAFFLKKKRKEKKRKWFITLREKNIGVLKLKLGNAKIASVHTLIQPLSHILIIL